MRVSAAIVLLPLLLSCQLPSSTAGDRNSAQGAAQGALSFELRDFRLQQEGEQNSDWNTWRGRGNLVTKAPEAQGKILMVFLAAIDKSEPSSKPTEMSVVVRDGIGLVETWDLTKKAPEYEWSVHGWVALGPAELKKASAPPTVPATP